MKKYTLIYAIAPPDSGHPRFTKHSDDIDYQIEADYSGLISPGLPNEVIRLIDVATFEPKIKKFGTDYEWSILESRSNVIDLLAVSRDDIEAQIAYVRAQIEMPQDKVAILGIGSDDALKVWLNGERVHENWVERGVVEDDDRVKVHFKKGTNQLVLKIQNTYVGWGFCCRMLGQ